MQLKKNVKNLVMMGCVLALSACSAPGHKGQDQDGTAYSANDGAQSSGIGSGSNFGDSEGGSKQSLAKRTYYFDYDKSQIRSEDKAAISANADYLTAHANAKIILEGHTDPRGSREYNVGLGERRADAVLEFMKEKGVNPDQIRVVSYGAQRPAAQGRNESDYQLDRRVVLVYRG
jgi:peptidoglycan-associated lipoprotein